MTQSTRESGVPPPGADPADASTGELVRKLSTQLTDLVRGELALARAELTAKGKKFGVGAGLAGVAGVLALYAGGVLIAAAVAAIALLLPVWAAALIVGVALLVVAGILALAGRSQIQHASPLAPEQAADGVKRDIDAVRGGLHR